MCIRGMEKRKSIKGRLRIKKKKKVDSLNFKLFAFSLPKHKVSIVQTKGLKVSVGALRAHTRVTTIGLNS